MEHWSQPRQKLNCGVSSRSAVCRRSDCAILSIPANLPAAITRAFTLIYCIALLSLLTRIQLSLLGRKNYFLSIVSQVSSSPQSPTISLEDRDDDGTERARGADFETNRKYLTFSWWLLHRGWSAVMTTVQNAVQETFGTVKPTEDITVDRMSQLILDVRRKVEGSTTEERRSVWIMSLC